MDPIEDFIQEFTVLDRIFDNPTHSFIPPGWSMTDKHTSSYLLTQSVPQHILPGKKKENTFYFDLLSHSRSLGSTGSQDVIDHNLFPSLHTMADTSIHSEAGSPWANTEGFEFSQFLQDSPKQSDLTLVDSVDSSASTKNDSLKFLPQPLSSHSLQPISTHQTQHTLTTINPNFRIPQNNNPVTINSPPDSSKYPVDGKGMGTREIRQKLPLPAHTEKLHHQQQLVQYQNQQPKIAPGKQNTNVHLFPTQPALTGFVPFRKFNPLEASNNMQYFHAFASTQTSHVIDSNNISRLLAPSHHTQLPNQPTTAVSITSSSSTLSANANTSIASIKQPRTAGEPTNVVPTPKMDRKTLKRLRNRVSASRCRVKKKLWIHDMELQAERLAETNSLLQHRIHLLEEAINQSRQMLAYHDSVGEILAEGGSSNSSYSKGEKNVE